MVKISEGNSKIGKIFNISLPPVKSCGNCDKCKKECYALKRYRVFPNVRNAWQHNLDHALNNPEQYFADISEHISKKKPANFRWHVAGDILNYNYFCEMIKLAVKFPNTNFLCFTKMHHIVHQYLDKRMLAKKAGLPSNFKIFLSVWIDEEIDNFHNLSTARVVRKGETMKYDGFICGGKCEECMVCFEGKKGSKVIFEKH